jgi:hypothetical protein
MLSLFTGIIFLLFLFSYEETKYVPTIESESTPTPLRDFEKKDEGANECSSPSVGSLVTAVSDDHRLDPRIPLRAWRQRLALFTPTSEPIWPLVYRPFIILFTFPAVMFTAIQYSFQLCWLVNVAVTSSVLFSQPPYEFNAAQLAYMGLGPLVGSLLGSIYSGPLSDRAIIWMARRNKGLFEPEMRLKLLHLPTICTVFGIVSSTLSQAIFLPAMTHGYPITLEQILLFLYDPKSNLHTNK